MRAQTRAAVSRKHLFEIVVAGVTGLALTDAVADPPRGGDDCRAEVTRLAIDGRGDDPIGVDDVAPRLSWQVTMNRGWTQAAYQIRAARTAAELATGPYLWDTGKVRSDNQNDIPWGGSALRSREAVAWQVRTWSIRGDATAWSRPATWEMGLLARGDWSNAAWIEYPGRSVSDPLPVFARAFTIGRRGARITKARLYLSGLGLHAAELNGEPVTDEVLAPGNSNYQLSAEYRTYDVTRLVAGDVRTSSDRINRIHRIAQYSMMSNIMSTFTDCPGREKLAYPADYVKAFSSLHRNFEFLRIEGDRAVYSVTPGSYVFTASDAGL